MNKNATNLHYILRLSKVLNHIFYRLKKFKQILHLESKFLSITPVNYLEIQFIINKKQKVVNNLNFLDKRRISLEKFLNIQSDNVKDIKLKCLWKKIQRITQEVYEQNEKNNKKINSQMQLVNTLQKTLKKIIPEAIFYRSDGNSCKSLIKNFESKA